MADEDKGLNAKEQQSLVDKILTELRKSRAETTKGQENARKTFEDKLDNLDGLTDEMKTIGKQAGMLEQSFGFTKQAAMSIAKTTDALELTKKRMEEMESVATATGQDVTTSAEYKRLELEKKNLEEFQKFGRNLSGFEKTFVKFAGGTFEEMKKSIEENGRLTQQGIFSELGSNLKSDFDRVLTFLGPIGGFLQQIPLLGTVLTFIGDQLKSVLVRLVLSAKERLIDGKRQRAIDKQNLALQKRGTKAQEQATRDRYKTEQMGQLSGQTLEGQRDMANRASDAEGGGSFRAASIFLGVAAASGVAAGAGLSAAAVGMSAFATAAFKFAGALAVGGLALGVGLTGIFGAFALGDKMGAFEGMQEFGKVNMLKVLGAMLGLATLMGVLGAIVTTGVGALIMGVGAVAVMAMIGVLVVIGKGLGNFAESIMPFEQMNVPRIKNNIQQLASLSGDIDTLLDMKGGRGFSQLITDHPLAEIAEALDKYDKDMEVSIANLESLKGALSGFEYPELPKSELTIGGFFRGLFGEDFAGEIAKISEIELTKDLGMNLGFLGTGLDKIGKALNSVDEAGVERLERLSEALEDMENVTLNFGMQTPVPAVQNLTPPDANVNRSEATNNVVVAPQVSNRVSNVSKRFNATGSNMGKHSALHYPSLG